MSEILTHDDRLAQRLLHRDDHSGTSARGANDVGLTEPKHHLDAETLAQFAAGDLNDAAQSDRRAAAVAHLADCRTCRSSLAVWLMAEADEIATQPTVAPRSNLQSPASSGSWLPLALAASVLLAVGAWSLTRLVGPQAPKNEQQFYAATLEKLRDGDFASAEKLAHDAERAGATSPRLRNLRAQAARKIPDPLALAYAGRLSDFGVEPGGIVARAPKASEGLSGAEKMLGAAEDRQSLLNRGHLELSRNRLAEARALFQQAVERQSDDAAAWLGLGLACFLADDFAAAEGAFAKAAALDPDSVPIAWNLATTLEELNRPADAAAVWHSLLPRLSDEDRRKIEAHLKTLE